MSRRHPAPLDEERRSGTGPDWQGGQLAQASTLGGDQTEGVVTSRLSISSSDWLTEPAAPSRLPRRGQARRSQHKPRPGHGNGFKVHLRGPFRAAAYANGDGGPIGSDQFDLAPGGIGRSNHPSATGRSQRLTVAISTLPTEGCPGGSTWARLPSPGIHQGAPARIQHTVTARRR